MNLFQLKEMIANFFGDAENQRLMEAERRRQKQGREYAYIGVVEDPNKPGQPLLTRLGHRIPVRRKVVHDRSKYSGEQLRELRRQQTLDAISKVDGRYNDGTPIMLSLIHI